MDRPAERYTIHQPLKFRSPGEPAWRHGIALNISASGLLFTTCERPPEIGAKLEVYFAEEGEGLSKRIATARVARRILHCWPDPCVQVAVQFAKPEQRLRRFGEETAAEDKKHRGSLHD